MPQPQRPAIRNRLLDALSAEDASRLFPDLEHVTLDPGVFLITANRPIEHAYFVERGVVSLVTDTDEGRVEIGFVGYEGLVGISLVLYADRTPHGAMVQVAGTALRIPAAVLSEALGASPALRRVLCRYVQSLVVQLGQTVHAAADLTIEGRLARWILMAHDRCDGDELALTHDFLSIMLGVRRPSVTAALHVLEGTGTIRSTRGRVTVCDREKLQDLAGDSYGLAEAEYERLLAEASGDRTINPSSSSL